MVCFSPTMPKRGALSMTMRRSRLAVVAGEEHVQRRVGRQRRRGRPGMSWTWPSVSMTTAPIRSGGTSARPVAERAEELRAVDRPPAAGRRPRWCGPRRSRNSARRCLRARRPLRRSSCRGRRASGWRSCRRPGRRRSDSGSRSSLSSDRVERAPGTAPAAATARSQAPRMRRKRPGTSSSSADDADARRSASHGSSGAKDERPVHAALLPEPLEQRRARAPGRPCSCRSACTSRC